MVHDDIFNIKCQESFVFQLITNWVDYLLLGSQAPELRIGLRPGDKKAAWGHEYIIVQKQAITS